jgi:hypothetical protein
MPPYAYPMRFSLVGIVDAGLVVRRGGVAEFVIPYEEILTAERLRSGRGFDLHTRGAMKPVRVRCPGWRRDEFESGLRSMGVRVVDCLGAIISPTLTDFAEELAREPVKLRQSSDDA